jgi:glycosyltransferase involved in cell wall biosynthesis
VIPLIPKLYDEPFADSSQIPTYLVSKIARARVTVSLSGDGGDELFGGYNRYFLTRTLMRRLSPIPAFARHILGKSIRAVPPALWDSAGAFLKSMAPGWKGLNRVGAQAHKLANVLATNDPWEAYREVVSHWPLSENLVPRARPSPHRPIDDPRWSQVEDVTQRMMLVDLVTYLPDDILVKVDRASMGNSLESRAPFLDHSLVEFALRLPLRLKMRDGVGKWILRQLLRNYVPTSLINRPKMGFGVPLGDWLRGPLRAWAEDLLSERQLASDGFLNSKKVRARWNDHLAGRQNWPHHLWDVLMFQAWLRDRDEPGRESLIPAVELHSPSARDVERSDRLRPRPDAPATGPLDRRIKVLHIISGLDTGGAEQMLLKLLERTDREWIQPEVISMTTEGALGRRVRGLNVPLYAIGMKRGLPNPGALLRIVRILRRSRPNLLHSWMYHANLAAAIAKLLGDTTPIVWSIRSDLAKATFPLITRTTIRLCALLSRAVPAGILYNSLNSRKHHTAAGYAPRSALTIPNGFDTTKFVPSPDARRLLREELLLHDDTPLIGMVSRFNPAFKDHQGFIAAASLLRRVHPSAHFLLCGRDIDSDNRLLRSWIHEAHLEDVVHLLGERTDIPRINAALDIATLASHQEAFPNVVGEAMSCGTPIVATDVGDCRSIIGDAGLVTAPGDPPALADAWSFLLSKGHEYRVRLGALGRARIEALYSIDHVARLYQNAYRTLLGLGSSALTSAGGFPEQGIPRPLPLSP